MAEVRKNNLTSSTFNNNPTSYSYENKSSTYGLSSNESVGEGINYYYDPNKDPANQNYSPIGIFETTGDVESTLVSDTESSGFTTFIPNFKPMGFFEHRGWLRKYSKARLEELGLKGPNATETYKYYPKVKYGHLDGDKIGFTTEDWPSGIPYDGEYLKFNNWYNNPVYVPLATIEYKDGKTYFVPMTEEQKRIYAQKVTQYYNDIMKKRERYTDEFNKGVEDVITKTAFLYFGESSNDQIYKGAAAWVDHYTFDPMVAVKTNDFVNIYDENDYRNGDDSYNFMVNAYTHELGHIYDHSIDDNPYREKQWQRVNQRVHENKENRELLGRILDAQDYELYAECINLYYNNPDKLKMVDIGTFGYDNLYDYIDDEMHGQKLGYVLYKRFHRDEGDTRTFG